ncbi:ferritin-like domain-containing protein [Ferrimonas pelagia]|uniref:Iminophenyl-pyruvate dimer synthase domain-containing protein n=1 Tax=Ferrimonas pelagia TaxID=1177826 RepID=A0ABP9EMH1_9GAMM
MQEDEIQFEVVEPLSRLTQQEIAFFNQHVRGKSREEVLCRLKQDVQTACTIELATIPIYLYSYYSLVRDRVSGADLTPEQIFANKAGAGIMSVAVEEMLHMSLASNLYYALTGTPPKLYGSSPASYPTGLPYHNPLGPEGPEGIKDAPVSIPLGKFGYEQLWHFLQIENPGPRELPPKDRDWDTIGQFYSFIRCLILSEHLTDADFSVGATRFQIQPYNYSPNNVDTVFPRKSFDPWKAPEDKDSAAQAAVFTNAPESHTRSTPLITIRSKLDALAAIDTICDQGEGFNRQPTDDPSGDELSHYYKFLTLQAQFDQYAQRVEQLPDMPAPPAPVAPAMNDRALMESQVLFDFPQSPKLAQYPPSLRPIVEFCNGLYQYMLIMTETIFYVEAEPDAEDEQQSQKYYFNIALHRSMIWVLDKYVQTMRNIQVSSGPYAGKVLAPTFEFVNLGPPAGSFARLKQLGQAAVDAARSARLADVDGSVAGNITYYVETALTRMQGHKSMHLPDVGDYFDLRPQPIQ